MLKKILVFEFMKKNRISNKLFLASVPLTQFIKVTRRDDTGRQGDNRHSEKG